MPGQGRRDQMPPRVGDDHHRDQREPNTPFHDRGFRQFELLDAFGPLGGGMISTHFTMGSKAAPLGVHASDIATKRRPGRTSSFDSLTDRVPARTSSPLSSESRKL